MDAQQLYILLDTILISPYRLLPDATAGFWTGTVFLAALCVLGGEIASFLVYVVNRSYYRSLNNKMVRMHNISVEAIRHKDKESFKAANKWANEYFGKVFFSQAAYFGMSLWPVPFALAWLQGRFNGITIHTIPFTELSLGYPFVLITCYIALRWSFSRIRKYVPLLRHIETMRAEDIRSTVELKSWGDLCEETDGKPDSSGILSGHS